MFRTFLISLFIMGSGIIGAQSLDLNLNYKNIAVLDDSFLVSFSTHSLDNLPVIRLSSLFPWMEDVYTLDVHSADSRLYFNKEEMAEKDWDSIQLTRRDTGSDFPWELQSGTDVIRNLQKIDVSGLVTELQDHTLRIITDSDLPRFEVDIRQVAEFKNLNIEWSRISHIPTYLNNTNPEHWPHIIIFDILEYVTLEPYLDNISLAGFYSSQWYSQSENEAGIPDISSIGNTASESVIALDLRNPLSALQYLLNVEEGYLDSKYALRTSPLKEFFTLGLSLQENGKIQVSQTPLEDLVTGTADYALRLPENQEISNIQTGIIPVDSPEGYGNILRPVFAALTNEHTNTQLSTLLVSELPYMTEPSWDQGILLEPNARLDSFIQAYNRIGRLAISSQMDANDAAALISRIVTEQTYQKQNPDDLQPPSPVQ